MTREEYERRMFSIGASDAPIILGFGYDGKTSGDLYLEKKGLLDCFGEDNQAMKLGRMMERLIIDDYIEENGGYRYGGVRIGEAVTNDCIGFEGLPFQSATIDLIFIPPKWPKFPVEVVEVKTAGLVSPLKFEEWGPGGTDEIPERYIIQVHHQMMVMGVEQVTVRALLGGKGVVTYTVGRDPDLIRLITKEETRFWNCVERYTPPDWVMPSVGGLRRRERDESEFFIDASLVKAYLEAKGAAKLATEAASTAERALLSALGESSSAAYDGGGITFYETKRKRADGTNVRQLRIYEDDK